MNILVSILLIQTYMYIIDALELNTLIILEL